MTLTDTEFAPGCQWLISLGFSQMKRRGARFRGICIQITRCSRPHVTAADAHNARNPPNAGGTRVQIQCQPVSFTAGQCLPAAVRRVITLISLRIYACVADEKETIHAQASEIER